MKTLNKQLPDICRTSSRPQLFLILLLMCHISWAWSKSDEKELQITHDYSFQVGTNDLLRVDNRFGNITVTHWNEKKVSIHVVIESKAKSEQQARESIERVDISAKQVNNEVIAITTLKEKNGNRYTKEQLAIHYYIKIPSKLKIDLMQKYGNIILPEENDGTSTLNVKYGNIQAGNFTAPLNLEAKYGNVNIGSVARANLDVGYCGNVVLLNASDLQVDAKYSNLDVQNIDKLSLENKYGNIKTAKVKNASIEVKYGGVTLGEVQQSLMMEISYSSGKINLASNFQRVAIEARYGNVNLYVDPQASFRVRAEDIKYGSYELKGFHVTRSSVEDKINYFSEINGGTGGNINFEGNNYSNLRIRPLKSDSHE